MTRPEGCRSCGQEVEWALTTKGRRIPLNTAPADPHAHGSLVLIEQEGALPWAVSYDKAVEAMVERGLSRGAAETAVYSRPCRVSHFATCPQGPAWRRRRARSRGSGRGNS